MRWWGWNRCLELKQVLKEASQCTLVLRATALFVQQLIAHVEELHNSDHVSYTNMDIPATYNPPGGTAYYFTQSGCQVRRLPTYKMLSGKKSEPVCTKLFPQVSYGGFGYLMAFFCPLHGHCYGFHLISGGEGRKDVFSALWKFKPSAPEHLFYDFACQLQHYCLNREPNLFLRTRFWHDIFHSFNHKCGSIYKSKRVAGLGGVNSEIAEQFNSYLQCIKYTGSHLSQPHFMFFTQVMVHFWNQEKTRRHENIASVAVKGLL